MDPFKIVWHRELSSDQGSRLANLLVNDAGLFIGKNGAVYRVDFWSRTGEEVDKNTLPGKGYTAVTLAAPPDASVLIVGINGYVLCLDPKNLAATPKWDKRLPDCGYTTPTLHCVKDRLYAACAGLIFRLDPTNGDVIHHRQLLKTVRMPAQETRLATTPGARHLFAGSEGHAVGLDPDNLGQTWIKELKLHSVDDVSVVAGVDECFAGTRGLVYRLNAANGDDLTPRVTLNTSGYSVHLSLSQDRTRLYAGCNGYAIGLRPIDLKEMYTQSLPGCGWNITKVLAGNDCAYYACNGYVYQYNDASTLEENNELKGLGTGVTNIALEHKKSGLLFGTVDTNIFALSLKDYPKAYPPWMNSMSALIGPKMLRDVAIPGTHNSGTFGMNVSCAKADDGSEWVKNVEQYVPSTLFPGVKELVKGVVKSWGLTQPFDFEHQLEAGIRYFDLRVQPKPNSPKEFYFVHGLFAAKLEDLLGQVNEYLSRPSHEKEIVILDFHKLYSMTDEHHKELEVKLEWAFGSKLAPASLGVDVTVDRLWNDGHQILIFYANATSTTRSMFLWPYSQIDNLWGNKNNIIDVKAYLHSKLPYTQPRFFALHGIVTPDDYVVKESLKPWNDAPRSIQNLAKAINPQLLDWIKGWKGQRVNAVLCDWFNCTPDFVQTVIDLNK